MSPNQLTIGHNTDIRPSSALPNDEEVVAISSQKFRSALEYLSCIVGTQFSLALIAFVKGWESAKG